MVTYLSTFGQDISMPCIHHILRLVPNSPVEEAPLTPEDQGASWQDHHIYASRVNPSSPRLDFASVTP